LRIAAEIARASCRRGDGEPAGRVRGVGLLPFGPQLRHTPHGIPVTAGNQFERAILILARERRSSLSIAEQKGGLPLALALLAHRDQDLRNLILPKRLALELDRRTGLDRLAQPVIADGDQLATGGMAGRIAQESARFAARIAMNLQVRVAEVP
jgi:hypothetical protein